MQNYRDKISLGLANVDPHYVRLALFLITLALFVIGAGAPDSGGNFPGG